MNSFKKYFAEFIGTAVLVFMGCGTAMLVGCGSNFGSGYLLTALAFGLTIVAMAYCVGNISGCHINPAVSLGVLINGGMSFKEFIGYCISQCLGATAGSAALSLVFHLNHLTDKTGTLGLGTNAIAGDGAYVLGALLVEIALTAIFVFTILGVTSKKFNHGSFGGLIIGLTLTFVHILGIGITGTSVNPARSFGPALIALIRGNSAPIGQLWVFIVGPFIGAAIAACIYKWLEKDKEA